MPTNPNDSGWPRSRPARWVSAAASAWVLSGSRRLPRAQEAGGSVQAPCVGVEFVACADVAVDRSPPVGDHAAHRGRQVGEVPEHVDRLRGGRALPEAVADQDAPALSQMLPRRREGGGQTAEGVRGADAEHQVEGPGGGEGGGVLAVQDESAADADAEDVRGPPGTGRRAPGDVDGPRGRAGRSARAAPAEPVTAGRPAHTCSRPKGSTRTRGAPPHSSAA
ncbi:hypothetical protein GCM10027074_15780 [Streptomyces deserti]